MNFLYLIDLRSIFYLLKPFDIPKVFSTPFQFKR